jgi:hypothetical protein
MWKILLKYAAQVTAAKKTANTLAEMTAAAAAGMAEDEVSALATGSLPAWRKQVDDLAWAGQTWTQRHPDGGGMMPELVALLDAALTPVQEQ